MATFINQASHIAASPAPASWPDSLFPQWNIKFAAFKGIDQITIHVRSIGAKLVSVV